MTDKLLLRVILLCLAIFQINLIKVYAQGPEDTEKEPIVVEPSGQLELTLEQLGHETERMSQNDPRQVYRVDLPGNFQISPTNSYLDLTSSHLPEIPDKPSLLHIEMNNNLVSSMVLTKENAISTTTRFELQEGVLQRGRNTLIVDLDTGGTCQDPGAFLNVLIGSNSSLSFDYQQNPYPTDLGLYPFPFTERSLLDIPVAIVLPNQPTSEELSAAAIIAAGLGQASGGAIELITVLASNLTDDIQNNAHLIVLGKPDTNDLINDVNLPLPVNEEVLEPGQGILQEIVSPWNEFRLVLVVSGLDDEGLLKAGQALNRQAHFLGMRGPVAVVVELGSLPEGAATQTSSFTFADLGYEDQVMYGIQTQKSVFRFNLPRGWQFTEPPFLVLKFAHADAISPESILDVELNGVPIGGTTLDANNATEGEIALSLPVRRLKTGSNRLEVVVEMGLPHLVDKCEGIGNQRAWTVVSSESGFSLPFTTNDLPPDLSFFPHPFSGASGLEQSSFVIPNQVSSQILDELIQLAVRLGSAGNSPDHTSIQVTYASEVDQTIRQNDHLILLGRPTENSLLAEINSYLPQPFVSNSDLLEPLAVDSVAFLPDPNRDAGLLEIIESPWNEDNSLLVVTGTTEEGLKMAAQTLLEQTRRLDGNLAVVEPIDDPFSEEANQVTTYSIDTRLLGAIEQGQLPSSNRISDQALPALANRWWK